MMNKIIHIVAGFFLFLLPLYFLPFRGLSTEFDKQTLLISFSLILLFLLIAKSVAEKKIRLVKTPFAFLLFFLAAFYLLSTLFIAPNKIDSFISPAGSGTFVALAILYLSLSQIFTDDGIIKKISNYLIISSSLVSLFYLFRQLTTYNSQLTTNLSPLGPLFSAALFLLPVAVYLGTILALHFVKANSTVSYIKLVKPVILLFVAFIITSATVLLLGYHLATDQRPLLLPVSFAWAIMLEVFKSFPTFLFGVGPANFAFAYSIAKPPGINLTPFWNLLPTTSSSLPFTLATEAGVIAFVIFAFIIVEILKITFFPPKSEEKNISNPYLLPLATTVILQLLFPSNIALLVLTVFFLAAASPKTEEKIALPEISFYYVVLPLGLLILAGLVFTGKFYLADIFYRRSITSANTQKAADAYNFSQKAVNLNPYSDRYLNLSSVLSLNIARNLAQSKDATSSANQQILNQLTQNAINQAKTAAELNRQNPQNWAQLASVYQALIGSVQGADQITLDTLSQQMAIDPANPLPKITAAQILVSAGSLEQALSLINQAINLKPDWNVAHYNLATLLASVKNYKNAAIELQKVLDLTPSDTEDYKKVEKELTQIKQLIPPESTPSATPSTNNLQPTTYNPQPTTQNPSPSPKPTNP